MAKGWLCVFAAVVLASLAGCGPDMSKDQKVTLNGIEVSVYPGAERNTPPPPPPGKASPVEMTTFVSSDSLEQVGRFYLARYSRGADIQGDNKVISIRQKVENKGLTIGIGARDDKRTNITLAVESVPSAGSH